MARWGFEHGEPAGAGPTRCPGAGSAACRCAPARARSGCWRWRPVRAARWTHEDRDLLDAFARQGALALERALLVDERESAALRARTEELRSSLLSAVSHDLRTPLAAITGAASALREQRGRRRRGAARRAARHDRRGGRAARAPAREPARDDAARVRGGRAEARVGAARGDRRRRAGAARSAARGARACGPSCPRICRCVAVDPMLLEQLAAQPGRERGEVHAGRLADRDPRRGARGKPA